MPKTVHSWTWEEAFQRHGFSDGDHCETERIEEAIEEMGYVPHCSDSIHNHYIYSVSREETFWEIDEENIRGTLPPGVAEELDRRFPDDAVFED